MCQSLSYYLFTDQDDTDTAEQYDTQLSQEDIFEHAADTSNDENDIDEETM